MAQADRYYIDRMVKTALWLQGGFKVYTDDKDLYDYLSGVYCQEPPVISIIAQEKGKSPPISGKSVDFSGGRQFYPFTPPDSSSSTPGTSIQWPCA